MEIRTQINQISADIKTSIPQLDVTQKIHYQAIKDLSSKILTTLPEYDRTEKSLRGRVETLQNLSTSLQELAAKVGGVKNFPQRLLTRFGFCMNESEKVLWKNIDQVHSYKDKYKSFFLVELIQKVGNIFLKAFCNMILYIYSSSTHSRMTECAYRTVNNIRVIEGMNLDPGIQGSPQILPFQSIQRDLEQFLKTHEQQLPDTHKLKLKSALSDLKFGESIAYDTLLGTIKGGSEELLADQVYKIEKQIENLSVGQSVIIPGGYATKPIGHGVIYEVQRLSPDNYQFVIYNTGEGATLGRGLFDTLKSYWNWQVSPIAYQNLSREAVSDQSFLMDILRFMLRKSESDSPIEEAFSIIQEHCKERHQGTPVLLKAHDMQTWGTCAFTSIMSYLKAKLPPDLYDSVEVHMLKTAREELDTLIPRARFFRVFNSATIDFIDQKSQERVQHLSLQNRALA